LVQAITHLAFFSLRAGPWEHGRQGDPEMMKRCILSFWILLSILSGCATTDLTNSWKNPNYSGGPLTKVLVVGISNQTSVRRSFEETFAQSLANQGVQAIPSYTLIPADGQIAEDVLKKAVEEAGADGILITRMVDRRTEISVSPASSAPPAYDMHRQYYGYYTGAWSGYYEPETLQATEYIIAETTLFRADAPEVVWSGTTRTEQPGDVRKATEGFAKVMIAAMRKKGLI
jgi:hypothetical protein